MQPSQHPQQPQLLPIMRFYDIVNLVEELYYPDLQKIAEKAKVSFEVLENMYCSVQVRRADAEKVLAAFSEYTKRTWTLDTCKVALLPMFADICKQHNLDLSKLAEHVETLASSDGCTLDMLIANKPVDEIYATVVLGIVTRLTGQRYTIDGVDISLLSEKQTNATNN